MTYSYFYLLLVCFVLRYLTLSFIFLKDQLIHDLIVVQYNEMLCNLAEQPSKTQFSTVTSPSPSSLVPHCLWCVRRFVGHSEWFRTDRRGKFDWDFLKHKDTPLEEVNMDNTLINYVGLSHFGNEQIITPYWHHPLLWSNFCLILTGTLLIPFSDIHCLPVVSLLLLVPPQMGSCLCGLCLYEDVLRWMTGAWPGSTLCRTLWRNWTSLTVHASQSTAWLDSGTSSN